MKAAIQRNHSRKAATMTNPMTDVYTIYAGVSAMESESVSTYTNGGVPR